MRYIRDAAATTCPERSQEAFATAVKTVMMVDVTDEHGLPRKGNEATASAGTSSTVESYSMSSTM